jgi:hypothetical protein
MRVVAGARLVFTSALTLVIGGCVPIHTGNPEDAAVPADAEAVEDACCAPCCPARDAGPADVDGSFLAPDGGGIDVDAGATPADDAGTPDGAATLDDAHVTSTDAAIGGADAGAPSDVGVCRAWPTSTIEVLFIGNSQIDVSNLPAVVSELSRSAPSGCVRIVGERFTLGGANLRDLWETTLPDGRTLSGTIATGRYEVVVIAESIDLAEFTPTPFPALFVDYAMRIIDASRAAGAVPLLYATPYIDAPDRTGFHAQADPQIALGRELHVGVAAGGLAWLRVWDERPELDLHAADHAHPGCLGTYVSASLLWSAIAGGSPIGLASRVFIEGDTGACAPISDVDANLFQRAAWAQQLATGP